MIYPKQLKPTGTERIVLLSGKTVEIAKATPVFKVWTGKPVKYTYGHKAVLNFYRKPEFAELGILRIFSGTDGKVFGWTATGANSGHVTGRQIQSHCPKIRNRC